MKEKKLKKRIRETLKNVKQATRGMQALGYAANVAENNLDDLKYALEDIQFMMKRRKHETTQEVSAPEKHPGTGAKRSS